VFIASRAPRASPPPHIEPKTIGLASLGAGLEPRGGGRRCLEVPPTGYTATANSNLNPKPHGPEPCRQRVLDCLAGSASAQLNSNGAALVSRRDLQ